MLREMADQWNSAVCSPPSSVPIHVNHLTTQHAWKEETIDVQRIAHYTFAVLLCLLAPNLIIFSRGTLSLIIKLFLFSGQTTIIHLATIIYIVMPSILPSFHTKRKQRHCLRARVVSLYQHS